MIVYRVRIALDPAVENDWLEWMKKRHIPDVMATGYFSAFRLTGKDGRYTIDYDCGSRENLTIYQEGPAKALQAEHARRYEGRFTAEREIIDITIG